jgi:chloride channel 3/4/5
MSSIAAYLVNVYTPWMVGSGIPEIKTILAGYVLKGFLSLRVLFVKSITLVSR